ncbi:MAG TPA: YitT family protein [Bacilli bacterium]
MKKRKVLEWLYITLGVAIAAFPFSFFLDPINLVIGGIAGIGTILNEVLQIDTAFIILVINIVLLFIGLFFLGKEFFIKTTYGSLIFPGFIKLFEILFELIVDNPIQDRTIVVFFSSIMMGAGLGIVIKYGGTTGGSEIPQNIFLKYFNIPYSVSLYFIDGIVILAGAIVFKDLAIVVYGIIFIYLSGFAIDQVVFSGFNKRAVYIISNESERIKARIINEIGRGVTQIKVVGGYSNQNRDKLVCVLSTFQFYKLKKIIQECDKNAFYYVVRASEVGGEGFTYERD